MTSAGGSWNVKDLSEYLNSSVHERMSDIHEYNSCVYTVAMLKRDESALLKQSVARVMSLCHVRAS